MPSLHLPSVRLQHRSEIAGDSCLSLLMFLLRGLAALQVAAGHLRGETFPSLRTLHAPTLWYQALAFVTGFAHQAVVVFFLLSGWLVGGKLLNEFRRPQAMPSYFVDRITRLWTVLLPTLLLTLGVAFVIGAIVPGTIDFSAKNEYSALTFLGNLLGLQTVLVKTFAGNYSLWSLASEMWYYIAFPILLGAIFGSRGTRLLGVLGLAAIAYLIPYAMSLYFAIWLLGALFSRVRIDCSSGVRVMLIVVTACISIYYRLTGSNADLVPQSFVQDLVCSLPFLIILTTLQFRIDPGSRLIRPLGAVAKFLSDISFTLYVIHVPTIVLLRYIARNIIGRDHLAPDSALDFGIYFGMVAAIVAAAYVSYLLFEAHTPRVRRYFRNLMIRPAQQAPVRAALAD